MSNKRKIVWPTEEEERAIKVGIAADPDNPEWTDEDFAKARPPSEVHPALAAKRRMHVRGPQKAPTKVAISLRVDRDVVEKLRASGPGWQQRANAALRKAVGGR